ncbi:hypothetical protein AMTRI_Chr06g175690 [Amborella trichopoda]
MEIGMKKFRQVSPERGRPWSENTQHQKQQQQRKVAVVYYLCRNRHLEHPHFIEVPLASPRGLYLRDFISRLNAHRGRGMTAMYSWSCKRSYKSGFVWHDLSEDDLIHPVNGNEYVLKGSELLDEPSPDRYQPIKLQQQPQLQASPKQQQLLLCQEASSSSITEKPKTTTENDHLSSAGTSPNSITENSSEYKVYKAHATAYAGPTPATDAATQTEDRGSHAVRGVSTEEALNEGSGDEASPPPPSSSSASSSGGRKAETLESLIKADCKKMNGSFRIMEDEEEREGGVYRSKGSNVLMQLISCGSIAVKEGGHGSFGGLMMKPRLVSKSSMMMGELDCLYESNPRFVGLRLEDKEYFSGSLIETKKKQVGEGVPTLKRSSSCNADRGSKMDTTNEEKEKDSDTVTAKCIPRTTKKQPKSGEPPQRSPLADAHRKSTAHQQQQSPLSSSKRILGASQRFHSCRDHDSEKGASQRFHSFRDHDSEKIIKIEESFLLVLGL